MSIGKRLGTNLKVVTLKTVRKPGFESVENCNSPPSAKCSKNDFKLENNVARARTKVQEYALSNNWDYFCTFTISKEKFDRYDLKQFYKTFAKFINNYNTRSLPEGQHISYLIIPEKHKDGAWHMHGLISGIKPEDLYTNKYGYLVWKQYEDKFGYISMDYIKDIERCSSYIMKYITKDLANSIKDQEKHLYYCSKGLKTAEIVFRETNLDLGVPYDYESNDGYIKVKTFYNFFDKRDRNETDRSER